MHLTISPTHHLSVLFIEKEMVTPLRSQVLAHYKKLIRTAQGVFQNDPERIASELFSMHTDFYFMSICCRYDTRHTRKFRTL